VVYKDIYSVFLDKKLVLQFQNEPKECFPYEKLELTKWLLNAVDEVIASLIAGAYNDFVRDNLPYRKRVGKILRKDYWRIFPDEKAAQFYESAVGKDRCFGKGNGLASV